MVVEVPVLIDVLRPGLEIVFCGTAASTESARRGAYYAGPGNKFWRTLHRIGLTPRLLAPEEFGLLPEYGLGLTDMVKGKAGMDHTLRSSDFGRAEFERRILDSQPRYVCFNGKRAASAYMAVNSPSYGLQSELRLGATRLFVAPSTSGAASGFWDERVWFELASLIQRS